MRDETEGWPGSGKIRVTVAKDKRMQVYSIFINQATFGQAVRQVWSSNFNLSDITRLYLMDCSLKIFFNQRGIRTGYFQ